MDGTTNVQYVTCVPSSELVAELVAELSAFRVPRGSLGSSSCAAAGRGIAAEELEPQRPCVCLLSEKASTGHIARDWTAWRRHAVRTPAIRPPDVLFWFWSLQQSNKMMQHCGLSNFRLPASWQAREPSEIAFVDSAAKGQYDGSILQLMLMSILSLILSNSLFLSPLSRLL